MFKNLPADVGDRGSRNHKTWVQYLTLGAYYLSDLRNSVSSFMDLFLNFLFIHSNLIVHLLSEGTMMKPYPQEAQSDGEGIHTNN